MTKAKVTLVPSEDRDFRAAVLDAIKTSDKGPWDDEEGIRAVTERLVDRYPNVVVEARPPADMKEFMTSDVWWRVSRDGRP